MDIQSEATVIVFDIGLLEALLGVSSTGNSLMTASRIGYHFVLVLRSYFVGYEVVSEVVYIDGCDVGRVGGEEQMEALVSVTRRVRANVSSVGHLASASWLDSPCSTPCDRHTKERTTLTFVNRLVFCSARLEKPLVKSKKYISLYSIHTTQSPAQHLDHGTQEERRCSCSLNSPSFDSQTFSRTNICLLAANQAHRCIYKAHIDQVHHPQLDRCSRDRFGRMGPLCPGHPPARQAD